MVSDSNKSEELDSIDDDGDVEELPAVGEEAEKGMQTAPEMKFSMDHADDGPEEVLVKYCVFCRELIPVEAIACNKCGHVVHIFEGKAFKQLYWFFWGAVITFVGCFLPYASSGDSIVFPTACTTFSGAIYLIFALLLMAAMGLSIYGKRLIISPVFLFFFTAFHAWKVMVERASSLIETSKALPDEAKHLEWYEFLFDIDALNQITAYVGSGLILVLLGSTIVTLTFLASIASVFAGAGKTQKSGSPRGRRR